MKCRCHPALNNSDVSWCTKAMRGVTEMTSPVTLLFLFVNWHREGNDGTGKDKIMGRSPTGQEPLRFLLADCFR